MARSSPIARAFWAGLFHRRVWPGVHGYHDRFIGGATPGALGAIRAWTCAILCYHTLASHGLAGIPLLPEEMLRPMGVMDWLRWLPIGYEQFLANAAALTAFQYLTAVVLLCAALGLGTRVAVPLGAACYLVVAGIERQYSFFNHGGMVPWYVLVVLSCTRCDQGFSIDRLWRRKRGRPVPAADRPAAEFGWARHAVWTAIVMVYSMAALSKVYGSGFGWVGADNMRAHLLRPNLKLPYNDEALLFSILQAPDLVFVFLGAVTLGTQLAFVLVLVSRWARLVLPATMILVHVGIWFLMDILFLDLMLLLLVFYDWRPLRAAVQRLPGVAPVSAAPAPDATHRRGALTTLAIVALAGAMWIGQVTFYPLSSIPLFIVPESPPGIVRYERLIAHYEDGTRGEPPLAAWFRSLRAFRFRPVAGAAFQGPQGRELAREFLAAAARAAQLRGQSPRVLRLEFQLWHWDFARDRVPPGPGAVPGVLVDRVVHVVDASAPAAPQHPLERGGSGRTI